ncbi:DUF3087 domain-containing protein [Pseudoalteromonas aurantia]|uniref:DUF3087 domain-containing protein n=1 Tax=Pseudoalteromonas aurantia TaxID=43654 RepID=A0A5S3VD59_9GAMM|nr:DUF3087 domain-containing protein [Pseudoalteromonas aurantia]TMO70175.1 DUF3087 domain-containing protein [Pseudoalteromonas aurantia]TMO77462.1 DUF3087 domain-containing protein [Pseudoalteromonas aurantia]
MKLETINKARYRKHLNYVIGACVVALTAGSLGIAQCLIALFPDSDGSHFHWNLTGVTLTSVTIGVVLLKVKHHAFMYEVAYVWDLKQALNKITRKMAKLKKAAEQGNADAMLAIQFSYTGSKQLWELDDNTITMEDLVMWQAQLDVLTTRYNIELDITHFQSHLLKQF